GTIPGILLIFSFSLFAQTQNPFSVKKKQNPASTTIEEDYQIQKINGKALQAIPKANLFQPIHYLPPTDPRQTPDHHIQVIKDAGMPVFIKSTNPKSKRSTSNTPASMELDALNYLEEIKNVIPVKSPKDEFEFKSYQTDQLGMTHVKMQQIHQGVPVYGSEVVVHFSLNQEITFNGRYQPTPDLASVVPDITPEIAEQMVMDDLAKITSVQTLTTEQKAILHYDEPESELVVYQLPGYVQSHHLAWHFTVRPNFIERWEYFVDAKNGEILHSYNHTCSIGPVTGTATDLLGEPRTVHSFESGTNSFILLDASKSMYTGPTNALPNTGDGYIITADMNNSDPSNNPTFNEITSSNKNSWSATAVSAHFNAGVAYDYYKNIHGRNSIDGSGGDVVSFINVSDNGSGLDNAFWNGQAMFYGNGKSAFDPLAASLDVGGHEMTHGVVQSTANLEYQGQSGALNESFADVFGVMIDRDDWRLGEDVVRTNFFPSGALRDMSDPHNGGSSLNDNGWQPRHMNEIYTGSQDNGGVHINSGIPNYAFFLFATASGMTKNKAEKIYYRALDRYLTRSSKFVDCRIAVIQAATDLHGANSAEVSAA
ncbi:MAG: peptidase M4 family protein, partial [Bacteroidetes bacterium]|nr:peptidase M4 family protein [Bacteroidota bacterium]